MTARHIVLLFLYALFLIACNETQRVDEKSSNVEPAPHKVENKEVLIDSLSSQFNSVDINALKKQHGRGSTSTLLQNSECTHLFKPNSSGFYGMHFFVNPTPNKDLPYLAKAIVFAMTKPWKYADESETLIEITTYGNEISLSDKVKIGMSNEEIVKMLGTPSSSYQDFLFYTDGSGTILTIKTKNSIATAIRIGRYEKGTDLKTQMGIISKSM
jgi:hypothetical protein